jgi:hypothetical protein
MPRATKPPVDPDDAPLKRLGGGRWQTRDERFSIEPQSGTWVIVDAEQTDDFGLPLVRGPFPSLTAAKEAISSARTSEPAASPLVERIEQRRQQPKREPDTKADGKGRSKGPAAGSTDSETTSGAAKATRGTAAKPASRTSSKRPAPDEPPAEPGWLTDLGPSERGRARRLIASLAKADVADPEGIVRRDLVGDVPAVAAHAIRRRLEELGDEADAAAVVELLADGRDEALGVRWRLVDGRGRPILIESGGRKRR